MQGAAIAMVIALLLSPISAQTQPVKASIDDEIKSDLAMGPCKNSDRLDAVKRLFLKMGAA